jgi:hypothetical protein
MAEKEWQAGYIQKALIILEKFEVPVAAWRVHAAAWHSYQQANDDKAAETNRVCAEAYILKIANSFTEDEPLRKSFLIAASVRQVLTKGETRK